MSVIFSHESIITNEHLRMLSELPYSSSGTRRVCFHKSLEERFHAMLVQTSPEQSFPRHRHEDSDEFTIVVQGSLELTIWDRGIELPARVVCMGPDSAGGYASFVRMGTPHATRPLTSDTVYFEVKLGPFDKEAIHFL